MNSCDRVKPLLYLYRAGELAPADVAIIQRHLATCSRCSGIARDLRAAASDQLTVSVRL